MRNSIRRSGGRGIRIAASTIAALALSAAGAVSARAGLVHSAALPAGAPDGNNTYKLVIDPTANWQQANANATKMGGWLVTIDNLPEQEFVQNLLLNNKAPVGAYWFGLVKSSTTGQFGWSSKSEKPVYTHWAPNQPDNFGGNEKYGSLLWDGTAAPASVRARNGFWNDLPLGGYSTSQRGVTQDLVKAGYLVEFVGRAKTSAARIASSQIASSAAASASASAGTGGASSVPLPAAAFLAPLGMALVGYATRRANRKA